MYTRIDARNALSNSAIFGANLMYNLFGYTNKNI